MNAKQFVIASIVGTVVLYALGYVIWDMLFADFFAANVGSATGVNRAEQIVWALILGTLAYAVLLTLAIGKRASPASIVDGIKIGAIVGFLVWFTADFTSYGVRDIGNLTATVVDPLLEIVRAGISGAAIAVVLPKLA